MKHRIYATLLCLPLCASAFGDTALQLHSTNQRKTLTVEATTWRGEKALRIPLAFNAGEWKKAGFTTEKAKAEKNAPAQIGYLYVTATAYQLQSPQGKALLGGPRLALELDKTSCILMRSLTSSVCGYLAVREGDDEATARSNAFRQAHDFFRDVTKDFAGAYRTAAHAGETPAQPVYESATNTQPVIHPAVPLYTSKAPAQPALAITAPSQTEPVVTPEPRLAIEPAVAPEPPATPDPQLRPVPVLASAPAPEPVPAAAPQPEPAPVAAVDVPPAPVSTPVPVSAPPSAQQPEPMAVAAVAPAPAPPAADPAPVVAARLAPSEILKAVARQIQPTLADVPAASEQVSEFSTTPAEPAYYGTPEIPISTIATAPATAPRPAGATSKVVLAYSFNVGARAKSAHAPATAVKVAAPTSRPIAGSILYVGPAVVSASEAVMGTPVAAPAAPVVESAGLPAGPTAPHNFAQPAVTTAALPSLVASTEAKVHHPKVVATSGFDVIAQAAPDRTAGHAAARNDDLTPSGAPRGVTAEDEATQKLTDAALGSAGMGISAQGQNSITVASKPRLTIQTVFASATIVANSPALAPRAEDEVPNTGSGSATDVRRGQNKTTATTVIAK